MAPVKFSIQLFGLPSDQFGPIVTRADELGFEVAWLSDHTVTPVDYERQYPYSPNGDPGYSLDTPFTDVPVALGHLAALTENIKLAAGVFVLPLRNPFHVASAWATVQNLSDGRAILGIGAGWMEEEFAAVGMPFRDRGRRLDEMLDVLDLLWSGETVEFEGEHYQFPAVRFGVRPEHRIPLVFGGHGRRALRRAALRGDGWFGPNVELAETLELTEAISGFRAQAGRDSPFDFFPRLHGGLTRSRVDAYADAGFEHVVLSPFGSLGADATLDERLERLDELNETLGVAEFDAAPPREAAG